MSYTVDDHEHRHLGAATLSFSDNMETRQGNGVEIVANAVRLSNPIRHARDEGVAQVRAL